jgi:hypothetical protein
MCGRFQQGVVSHEKEGGKPRSQAQMDQFREALEHYERHDLGFEGHVFTWRNHKHRCENYIRERLDRAVANDQWRALFLGMCVVNGDPWHSDHRPVISTTEGWEPRLLGGPKRRGLSC